jgi:glycosyltransferase involved in cell wall biosynthesis
MKISATIITLNEEKNIADCLDSLDFVDEIVVVDSGSTDGTESLCNACPKVKFFHQDWLGYGKQKNKAAEFANNNWILNVDADERVSDELRNSIISADVSVASAFRMARENYFGTTWIKHCGWYPDYTTRLYYKRKCSFSMRDVHETLVCDGSVGTLKGNLLHFTYKDIADYLIRMNRYSSLAALTMFKEGRRGYWYNLLLRPVATFFKMFVLRRGFADGWYGFVLSGLYAVYTFCKYAKLAELHRSGGRG